MHEDRDDDLRPSKSQRKRDMLALQALGERLVELPADRLETLEMPEDLRDAVLAARRITAHGGRRRQLQYIGRLMREIDPEPIRQALGRFDGTDAEARAAQHAAERWRERLLDQGDTVLPELFEAFPDADRQRIRQLVRRAQQERASGRPPRHQRELFRLLRSWL